jgi:hypothetical protein
MKYAAEMGSGAMIYIPSLIQIGSGIKKLMGYTDTQTGRRSHKPTLRKYANKGKVHPLQNARQLQQNTGSYVGYLLTSVSQTVRRLTDGWMIDELERFWKEAVVASE